MHYVTKICLLAAILGGVLVSIAATATNSTNRHSPDLTGKAVIVERDGWRYGVLENVRFATIGNDSFIVLPRPETDAVQYDSWVPLEKVSGIKVFDKVEDAEAHYQREFPSDQPKNEDAQEELEAME